ncbi:MAG: hypothetical protein WA051_02300 [Minisyncoccia bacterium]
MPRKTMHPIMVAIFAIAMTGAMAPPTANAAEAKVKQVSQKSPLAAPYDVSFALTSATTVDVSWAAKKPAQAENTLGTLDVTVEAPVAENGSTPFYDTGPPAKQQTNLCCSSTTYATASTWGPLSGKSYSNIMPLDRPPREVAASPANRNATPTENAFYLRCSDVFSMTDNAAGISPVAPRFYSRL